MDAEILDTLRLVGFTAEPTINSLIDACGDEFGGVYVRSGGWFACSNRKSGVKVPCLMHSITGEVYAWADEFVAVGDKSTIEEAIASLLIALRASNLCGIPKS